MSLAKFTRTASLLALLLATPTLHAQSAEDVQIAAPTVDPHPAGIAQNAHEAPAGGGLVALPGEQVPPMAQVTPSAPSEPAAERSMAFSAGGAQCRDTIPGGPVTIAAYSAILACLAVYALLMGRKNQALSLRIDSLERVLDKHRDHEKSAEAAP
ncbi:MAG: hypothetical protein Q8Q09_02500 [Deltaproteobacteria bacterium]|nr:hypothetical protein [Deltaproteobacteria bacterium]